MGDDDVVAAAVVAVAVEVGVEKGEIVVMGLIGVVAVGGVGSGRRDPALTSVVVEEGAIGS